MTIQQEAHALIETLPDESITMLVHLMSLLPKKEQDKDISHDFYLEDKQKAFFRMQELRKISLKYQLGNLDEEREKAFIEKYGDMP